MIIKEIGCSILEIETGEIFSRHWNVEIPNIKFPNKHIEWKNMITMRYIRKKFKTDFSLPGKNLFETINECLRFIGDGKCIFIAKGTALENRLLSRLGLNGEIVEMRTIEPAISIFDLTLLGVPKINDVFRNQRHNPMFETIFFLDEFLMRFEEEHTSKLLEHIYCINGFTITQNDLNFE